VGRKDKTIYGQTRMIRVVRETLGGNLGVGAVTEF
jgi:hypothetical protein